MDLTSGLALAGFLAVSFAAAASGAIFKPDDWYGTLRKPGWTPKPWVFPVVWTPLYIMIAVAGWLAWRQAGLVALPFAFYAAQMVLNAAWSAAFFGLRRPDLAFADLVLLWLSIFGTILAFAPLSATAAWLLAPYLLWVTIAGALNLSVWRLNPDRVAQA
ncbi:tryptophan-rich sensory protein [Lichenibacterium minor]|jgi:tryptophan-rich sensory protein|uniref:Tryptophan-rich sensory protein n=1 Tax=Lichenibacterium minor TaxID=2316528 RepID=A0A4Q2U4W8_9HYPH|nr:TspO/MBR family protein [Lichenibacterium minor]RYC31603.1 tryptophan-rich sensory protein [Lichenibacterium minor]